MTILTTLQPVYEWLAGLWNALFSAAGEWADTLYVILNQIWDVFQSLFTLSF
ncbi:MAG: hypothetical protein WC396_06375 [Bacteroidales bacterium]|jgi:hypothetical protein|nr:hypothetical protein [Bacteroidales bacterium]